MRSQDPLWRYVSFAESSPGTRKTFISLCGTAESGISSAKSTQILQSIRRAAGDRDLPEPLFPVAGKDKFSDLWRPCDASTSLAEFDIEI